MATTFRYHLSGTVKDGQLKIRDRQRFLSTFAGWPDGEITGVIERAHANPLPTDAERAA